MASLRKKVAELQLEVSNLKSGESSGGSTPPRGGGPSWLSSGPPSRSGGGIERPTTASAQATTVRKLEEQLNFEKTSSKRLASEVEMLKAEISKKATMGSSSPGSKGEGRLPHVPGVREIEYEEIEHGE